MAPERLASWLVVTALLGSLGCLINEHSTLTEYHAIDQKTGYHLKYEPVKMNGESGYVIIKSIYEDSHPQPTDYPVQMSGIPVRNFEQLKKWLKEEKKKHPDMHKNSSRFGFVT